LSNSSSSPGLAPPPRPPPEPLSLYHHGGFKQEATGQHHVPAASSYSNYPAYGGLPPPSIVMSREAPSAAAGGPGAAAVSPTYPRVSSTTHSDSDREGDIGKHRYVSLICIIVSKIRNMEEMMEKMFYNKVYRAVQNLYSVFAKRLRNEEK